MKPTKKEMKKLNERLGGEQTKELKMRIELSKKINKETQPMFDLLTEAKKVDDKFMSKIFQIIYMSMIRAISDNVDEAMNLNKKLYNDTTKELQMLDKELTKEAYENE